MAVRTARNGDEHRLAELNAAVQQQHHHVVPDWFKPPDVEALAGYFRDVLASDSCRVYVAEDDGEVQGYALARLHRRRETPFAYGALVVELDQITVDPDHRGAGVGRALVGAVKAFAAEIGAARLVLTVWNFNTDARHFFERSGFRPAMTRMEAHPDGPGAPAGPGSS